jgi:hypothetical protein
MYTGLHVKYPVFFSNFNETWVFWTDFRNLRTKFHENPFSEGRAYGWTDGQTCMTNLIVAFRSFVTCLKTDSAYLTESKLYVSDHRTVRMPRKWRIKTSFSIIFMTQPIYRHPYSPPNNRYIASLTHRQTTDISPPSLTAKQPIYRHPHSPPVRVREQRFDSIRFNVTLLMLSEIFVTKFSAISGLAFWLIDLLCCKTNS